jgi:peptidoglycan/LPS O-acetylase OafA/YrhL
MKPVRPTAIDDEGRPVSYRADIEGLRAISVIAVMGFHYTKLFPGGFTGVDVFFVISGYLITSILDRDIQAGRFSLLSFYDRRVRRILPAMLAVTLVTLVAGYLILFPTDYDLLGKSAVYSSAGMANIYFFLNTGYFDRQSDLLPLLHMWSLAVEEQFYIVWPLLLYAVCRLIPRRYVFVSIVVIISISFALSVKMVYANPKSAFYLPHPRSWELGIGALLVYLPRFNASRSLCEIVSGLGLLLVTLGIFALNRSILFPGPAALLPCVGAALLILPKPFETRASKYLSLLPMRYVGRISYSLYLWHWPVIALFRAYNNGERPDNFEILGLVVLSFILADISWRFIEQPFRRISREQVTTVACGVGAAALVCFSALFVVHNDGFRNRLPAQVRDLDNLGLQFAWNCPNNVVIAGKSYCSFGAKWETAKHKAFLWGDSHAEHFAPLIEVAGRGRDYSFILFRECPAILGGRVYRYQPWLPSYRVECIKTHAIALDYLHQHPEIELVAMAGRWSTIRPSLYEESGPDTDRGSERGAEIMRNELSQLIHDVAAPNRRFAIFADVPQWQTADPVSCYLSHYMPLRRQCPPERRYISAKQFHDYHGPTYDAIKQVVKAAPNTVAILPGEVLCKQDTCIDEIDGEFIYRDVDHIRRHIPDAMKQHEAELFGIPKIFDERIQLDLTDNNRAGISP